MKNNLITAYVKGLGLTAAFVIAINCFLPTGAFGQKGAKSTENCNAECQRDLARAAAATAQYHRESSALADGFFSTQECVAIPNVGAMGVHYVNLARSMNLDVNAAEPEILLYEPMANGKMRLVAVEYYAPVLSNGAPWFAPTPPPTIDNPAPVLFGRSFDGPMPGHEAGQPWHYDLHVWIWRTNPLGLFARFNPKVSCANE